jgi:hypothetical protein
MRKLPVIDAMSHAISSTKDNLGFAFNISWPWILALMPLNVMFNLYLVSKGIPAGQRLDTTATILSLVMGIVNILAYSSIAVNWHRYVLKDETPVGMQRLRLDNLTMRYFFNVIGIIIIIAVMSGVLFLLIALVLIPMVAVAIGSGNEPQSVTAAVAIALLFPFITFVLVTFYRLSVKLPAIALDRHDFGFGDAWRATQNNFWRFLGLFLLLILCTIVVLLTMLAATFIFKNFGVLGLSISLAIQVMVNWLTTIFGVTIITSLYGYFVEDRNF